METPQVPFSAEEICEQAKGNVNALALVFLSYAPLRAQAVSGTILGTVKDAQGAAVPGATVTARNLGTQFTRSVTTDQAGQYTLTLLPVGSYQLDVELFRWRYEDQQVSTITQDSQGVTNLATRNVGNATMAGAEVESEWAATEATRLRLGLQFLDATYDDFRYVTPLSSGPPLTGCDVTPGAAGFT